MKTLAAEGNKTEWTAASRKDEVKRNRDGEDRAVGSICSFPANSAEQRLPSGIYGESERERPRRSQSECPGGASPGGQRGR